MQGSVLGGFRDPEVSTERATAPPGNIVMCRGLIRLRGNRRPFGDQEPAGRDAEEAGNVASHKKVGQASPSDHPMKHYSSGAGVVAL